MKYQHRFTVSAPIKAVAEFHRQSASMGAITPPPLRVTVHHAPERLNSGDEMAFSLQFGPVRIDWLALVEDVSPTGFVDRQIQGPFRQWTHRHSFVAIDEVTTEVRDEVEAELKPQAGWWLVGLGMWLNLPLLFAYRGWKTRRLLEQQAQWIES